MERNYFADNLKVLAIFLVVFTHTLMPMYASTDEIVRWVYNCTFFIHMPIFFFVSGLYAKFDAKKIFTRYLYPYILFQVVMFVFYYVTNISALDVYFPFYSLWFLLVLPLYLCFVPLLEKVQKRYLKVLIFLFSFGFALAIGFVELPEILGIISRAFCMLPFFLFGYFFKNVDFSAVFNKKYLKILAIFVLLAIFVATFFIFRNVDMDRVFYSSYSYAPVYYRVIRYIFTFLVLLAIFAVIPKTKNFFSVYGKRTKTIYLYHVYIAFPLSFLYNHYDHSFVKIFVMLLVSVVIFFLLGSKWFSKCTKWTTEMFELKTEPYCQVSRNLSLKKSEVKTRKKFLQEKNEN